MSTEKCSSELKKNKEREKRFRAFGRTYKAARKMLLGHKKKRKTVNDTPR